MGTSCGRCRDAVRLCVNAKTCKFDILTYFAAIPQRADMVLERCTNAVPSPFGVTGLGALGGTIPVMDDFLHTMRANVSSNKNTHSGTSTRFLTDVNFHGKIFKCFIS